MSTGLTFNIFGKDVSATSALKSIPGEAEKAGEQAGSGFSEKFGDQLKSGFGDLKSKMGDLVGGLGLAATVGSALKGAWDNNNNQFKLQAALGLSPAQAKADAKTAGTIYANAWGDSLDDVDTALGAVRKSLGNMGQGKLEAITTQGLAFQQVFGVETQESVNAVSQMLRTGLAKNAQEAFDILTAGEQSGTDKAGDLIDTFTEYGTQFRKLGIDGKTALGLLQQGLQGGARDADIVADSIKEFSIRAIDGSKTTVAGFQALGLNAKKMQAQIAGGGEGAKAGLQAVLDGLRKIKDPAKQAQIATSLFGTQAEDMGKALFDLDPAGAQAAKGLTKIDGAGKKLTDTIGKTTSPLEALQRSAMATLSSLGAHALPILKPVLGVVSKLGPELAIVATGFAAFYAVSKIAAGITAFSAAVSALAVKLGIQTAATEAATVAQTELDVAMDANPIGLVVAAIAALAVGLVYAWKKSKTFRDVVKGVFGAIKTAALFLWDKILKPIFAAWKLQFHILAVAIKGAWDNVIKPVWSGIKTVASGTWSVLKRIFDAWKMQWRILRDVFKSVWDNGIRPVISAFATVWQTTWQVVKAVYGKIKDGIRGVRDVIRAVVGVIRSIWTGIGDGLQAVWDNTVGPIIGTIKSAINSIIGFVNSIISKIKWIGDHMPFSGGPTSELEGEVHWDPRKQRLVPNHNAQGTGFWGGGSTWVGENGPEMVRLPRGSQVIPHSTAMSQASGGGTTIVQHNTFNGIAATKADVGQAVATALEHASNRGVKARIGRMIVT